MSQDKVLYAYYDLNLSPISFDFAVFAINAEVMRRRLQYSAIHFVIVPGTAGGFRADDSEYDLDNKLWRLSNIVTPICRLMPCPASVSTCQTREEAKRITSGNPRDVFPEGYTVDEPIARFGWSQIISQRVSGTPAPSLCAGSQALSYMHGWIDAHASGRKPISISLRESSHLSPRNSNVDAWLRFAQLIDNDEFAPIIVRDTEKVFDNDPRFDFALSCPIAAVNLELRMALYELSWINLMILNGPAELCRLNEKTRYLIFKMVVPEIDNASPLYMLSQGFKLGGQLPHAHEFQRQIWEEDQFEIIEREFNRLKDDMLAAGEGVATPSPIDKEEPKLDVAVRLQMTGQLEEATTVFRKILEEDPRNSDAWHLMGIIAQQTGQPHAAENMFKRAIQILPSQGNYYVSLSALLRSLDRNEEAINVLQKGIAIEPNDAGAHADLSELLNLTGDAVASENEMMEALKLAPNSVDLYERAAALLDMHGNTAEALNFYRRAVEIRAEQQKTMQEASARMPENPTITLSNF